MRNYFRTGSLFFFFEDTAPEAILQAFELARMAGPCRPVLLRPLPESVYAAVPIARLHMHLVGFPSVESIETNENLLPGEKIELLQERAHHVARHAKRRAAEGGNRYAMGS